VPSQALGISMPSRAQIVGAELVDRDDDGKMRVLELAHARGELPVAIRLGARRGRPCGHDE
jgi:hypothetical protein